MTSEINAINLTALFFITIALTFAFRGSLLIYSRSLFLASKLLD